jgi:UDP-N-acetylglucosamine:LPS N-acetylglucosamine transferase
MSDSLATRAGKRIPFAILMTDWAEMTRYVWFPRGRGYQAISGTDVCRDALVGNGQPADRLFEMAGLLTRPEFLEPKPADLPAARRALGLDPALPVICMLYGGYGSDRMLELAETLRADPPTAQFVFLCGRNEPLVDALTSAALPYPVKVMGYTPDVHRYMAVSDVFVGKTGPLSISEALAFGLPLLIDRRNVLPQEHAVLKWIARNQAGKVFSTPAEFGAALRATLATEKPADGHGPARNEAARQIPEIVAEILRRGPAG